MSRLVLALLVVGAVLAGCAVPPHTLAPSEIQNFKLAGVRVELAAGALRSWPAAEESYARMVTPDDPQAWFHFEQNATPEQRAAQAAFVAKRLQDEISAAFSREFSRHLIGNRPVTMVVRVKLFDIPSLARRVFIESDAKFQADIEIVDAATGRRLARFEGLPRFDRMFGGVLAPISDLAGLSGADLSRTMIGRYVDEVRKWLLGY